MVFFIFCYLKILNKIKNMEEKNKNESLLLWEAETGWDNPTSHHCHLMAPFFFFNFPFVFLFNFGRACLVFHKGVAGTHKVLLLSLRVIWVDDVSGRNNANFNTHHHSTCNKPITSIILALFVAKQSKKNYFLKKCNITHCIPQSLHILNMIFNPRKNFYFFTMLMLTSAGCIWFYIWTF